MTMPRAEAIRETWPPAVAPISIGPVRLRGLRTKRVAVLWATHFEATPRYSDPVAPTEFYDGLLRQYHGSEIVGVAVRLVVQVADPARLWRLLDYPSAPTTVGREPVRAMSVQAFYRQGPGEWVEWCLPCAEVVPDRSPVRVSRDRGDGSPRSLVSLGGLAQCAPLPAEWGADLPGLYWSGERGVHASAVPRPREAP